MAYILAFEYDLWIEEFNYTQLPQTPGRAQKVDPPEGSIIYTLGAFQSRIGGVLLFCILPGGWEGNNTEQALKAVAHRADGVRKGLQSIVFGRENELWGLCRDNVGATVGIHSPIPC